MKLPTSAFTLTDWSEVAAAEHPGETGTSVWRTASSGDLRVLWSIIPRATPRGHCQSKFYTACSRARPGWSCTVFAHESWTRSAGFDAENGLYLFALTVPAGIQMARRNRDVFALAELQRLTGRLLLIQNRRDDARGALAEAVLTARQQGAVLYLLRALSRRLWLAVPLAAR